VVDTLEMGAAARDVQTVGVFGASRFVAAEDDANGG